MKSFQSVFSKEMEQFLAAYPHNKAERSRRSHLRQFDSFLVESEIGKEGFTEEHIWEWLSQQEGKRRTIITKLSLIRRFVDFLFHKGICSFSAKHIYLPRLPRKYHSIPGYHSRPKREFQSSLKQEISRYLSYIEETRKPEYAKSCRSALLHLDHFLAENHISEDSLDEKTINRWLGSMQMKAGSKRQIVFKCKDFFAYLNMTGISAYIPEPMKSENEYIPYIFSEAELESIFRYADSFAPKSRYPYMQYEFPMILRLLFGCGMRIGEVLSLQMKDVDLEQGIITVRNAKNEKDRLVPLHPGLIPVFSRYCIAMGGVGESSTLVFPGKNKNDKININTPNALLKDILRQIGVSMPAKRFQRGPCIHCFRHTFTVYSFKQAINAGEPMDGSVPYLSVYLGHEDLNATERYLKFQDELFPDEIAKFSEYSSSLFPEEIANGTV